MKSLLEKIAIATPQNLKDNDNSQKNSNQLYISQMIIKRNNRARRKQALWTKNNYLNLKIVYQGKIA